MSSATHPAATHPPSTRPVSTQAVSTQAVSAHDDGQDPADAKILATADELFYTHGVAGVTMAQIRDGAGITMRRLYTLYPSKADIVTGWLTHRRDLWTSAITAGVAQRIEAGSTPVDALFSTLETWLVATDFRGCGFVNTHAESQLLAPEQQNIIRSHKRAFAAYLDKLVPESPGLGVLVEGAIVQASIFGTIEPLHTARGLAHNLATFGAQKAAC